MVEVVMMMEVEEDVVVGVGSGFPLTNANRYHFEPKCPCLLALYPTF